VAIYLAGTADTKFEEIEFLRDRLECGQIPVRTVDLSTQDHSHSMQVTSNEVSSHHPDGSGAVFGSGDRGASVLAMGEAFANYCRSRREEITAMIGVGGGGGTAMITAGMRTLPYGVPKVMVSTLASGDVAPYVDVSDIIMVPSVTDIAGLNRLSRAILNNAAQSILGMVVARWEEPGDARPAIGLTMFGVTTPAVTAISELLRDRFDCLVFHATGTGGRAMEKLAGEGQLAGLLDITTTEIADLLVGGVLAAEPARLDVVAQTGIPYVGSVGAVDMVNFWAAETVPARYAKRNLYKHNANVTLMRTSARECAQIGEWIGRKLNACNGPVRFLLPLKGVSSLDIEGGAFADREADEALFEALHKTVQPGSQRRLIELPFHINDPEFADAAVEHFLQIVE